jgi:3-oxoacyl-[acyl-carrier protein] reductase
MDLGLKGRTVLITGGSKGIGAGAARVMAAEGANLILVARNLDALENTRSEILALSKVNIEVATFDLSKGERVMELSRRFPDIDILVNNAGAVPSGTLLEVTEQRWRDGWDSKIFPYINMCRAYYPLLKARGGGVIVNVLGIGSRLKRPDHPAIAMGNAALDVLTEILGASGPRDNIRVVGVSPGPVNTERYRSIGTLGKPGQPAAGTDKPPAFPFGRIATTEELGSAIAFAASERSAYTSGTIIVVDGGMSAVKATL